jgi:hypothetical protein
LVTAPSSTYKWRLNCQARSQSGGELLYAETPTNPAEYDDVKFKITDIDNVHYSLYYDDPEQQVNDIDMIDVDNSGENYKMYEDFVEYVLEGILY